MKYIGNINLNIAGFTGRLYKKSPCPEKSNPEVADMSMIDTLLQEIENSNKYFE